MKPSLFPLRPVRVNEGGPAIVPAAHRISVSSVQPWPSRTCHSVVKGSMQTLTKEMASVFDGSSCQCDSLVLIFPEPFKLSWGGGGARGWERLADHGRILCALPCEQRVRAQGTQTPLPPPGPPRHTFPILRSSPVTFHFPLLLR